MAEINLALADVRAAEARRTTQDGYEPVLKRSRWCLLKRPENLTDWPRIIPAATYGAETLRGVFASWTFPHYGWVAVCGIETATLIALLVHLKVLPVGGVEPESPPANDRRL